MSELSKEGKTFSPMKKMKKRKRILAEKEHATRTENKRVNSENRKARAERSEIIEQVSVVKILGYEKNMLQIELDGKIEKRALIFDKRKINKNNLEENLPKFELKLFGENFVISSLANFDEMKENLLWKLEEEFF
ncbi:MAG: hypothetical protein ACRCSK_08210 [Fusobacteriaceae bacterium]